MSSTFKKWLENNLINIYKNSKNTFGITDFTLMTFQDTSNTQNHLNGAMQLQPTF